MARLYRRPDICRRHPRPPRSQRPSHRPRRREPEAPTLQIDPKGLTTSLQLCQKSTASRARQPGDIISYRRATSSESVLDSLERLEKVRAAAGLAVLEGSARVVGPLRLDQA